MILILKDFKIIVYVMFLNVILTLECMTLNGKYIYVSGKLLTNKDVLWTQVHVASYLSKYELELSGLLCLSSGLSATISLQFSKINVKL